MAKPTIEELNKLLNDPDVKVVVQSDGSIRAEAVIPEAPPELTAEEQLALTAKEQEALKTLTLLYQENATLKEDKLNLQAQLEEANKFTELAIQQAEKAKQDLEGGVKHNERQVAALKEKDENYAQLEEKLKKSEKLKKALEDAHASKDKEMTDFGEQRREALERVKEHEKKISDVEQMNRHKNSENNGLKHELKRICILVQGGAVYGNRDTHQNDELTSLVEGAAGRVLSDEE